MEFATEVVTICDRLRFFDAGQEKSDARGFARLLSASIARTYQKRVAAGLQSGRDFVIPDHRDSIGFDIETRWGTLRLA